MGLSNQIATATRVLNTVASLHLPKRADAINEGFRLLECLTQADRHDGTYDTLIAVRSTYTDMMAAFRKIAESAEATTFEGIPAVLEDIANYWYRAYPPIPEDEPPEKEILAGLFPGGKLFGTYVEIGAWRPVEQSNTWQFYQAGNTGLLIEPIPGHWPALLTQRPRDHLCPYAASSKSGWQYIWANGPTSSFRPDKNPEDTCRILVETRTLSQILSWHPFISGITKLCTVDVEGWEDEVFAGWDWSTFRPEVLMVECLDDNTNWRQAVADQGYTEIERTEKNIILRLP